MHCHVSDSSGHSLKCMWLNTIKLTIRMLAYDQCVDPCLFALCHHGLATTPAQLNPTKVTEPFNQIVNYTASLIGLLHLVLISQTSQALQWYAMQHLTMHYVTM